MAADANEVYLRAAGLGVIAGLRSIAGPLLVSFRAARLPGAVADTPLRLITSERARTVLVLAALGEIVVDKLPVVPPRTSLGPLTGRVLSGVFTGAGVFIEAGQSALPGAVVGGVAAAAGAYLGRAFRETAKQRLHIPYALSGLVEDAVTYTVGPRIAGL